MPNKSPTTRRGHGTMNMSVEVRLAVLTVMAISLIRVKDHREFRAGVMRQSGSPEIPRSRFLIFL
ncbi:MAG: hypothetical protein D084_Lepto4C00394G0001 [Leptospirillum sp. Group IV 'UBA BS']|nr:MAG: hypothetical protein D084_Lepto4C00394G0001 [Leptospirillum sp. Group IV 'UBA BS']